MEQGRWHIIGRQRNVNARIEQRAHRRDMARLRAQFARQKGAVLVDIAARIDRQHDAQVADAGDLVR